MKRYRHKPTEVEASQWSGPGTVPEWLESPRQVVETPTHAVLYSPFVGSQIAVAGDWFVRSSGGVVVVMPRAAFEAAYEPAP